MKVTVNDVGGFWLQFTASIRHLHMERGMLDLLLPRGACELAFAISIATLMLIGVGESMREERPLLCGVMLWTRTLGTNRQLVLIFMSTNLADYVKESERGHSPHLNFSC